MWMYESCDIPLEAKQRYWCRAKVASRTAGVKA